MKDVYILAVESSCDETSVSIIKNGKEDIATIINSQIDVHTKYGGVVPEVASRLHLENITMVIDECLEKANMKLEDMDAFACTYAPGLLGSLLVGVEATKALSFIYNKPFIAVNHMMGHIYANMIGNTLEYPLLSLIVSGGHTDLILMETEDSFKYLGQTLDDAIGEAYDKVARILDLPYPGGPNVEKYALEGKPTYIIYQGKIDQKAMKKLNYNVDSLCQQLRSQQIGSVSEIQYAILETNGDLSILTKKDSKVVHPEPLILDGQINQDVLKQLNYSPGKLKQELKNQHVEIEDVFYCVLEKQGLFFIKK